MSRGSVRKPKSKTEKYKRIKVSRKNISETGLSKRRLKKYNASIKKTKRVRKHFGLKG